jgi:hypothetical protein
MKLFGRIQIAWKVLWKKGWYDQQLKEYGNRAIDKYCEETWTDVLTKLHLFARQNVWDREAKGFICRNNLGQNFMTVELMNTFPVGDLPMSSIRPLPYSEKSYEGHEVYTVHHFKKGFPYMEERLKHDTIKHLAEFLIEEDVVEWEVHEDTSHKSSLVLKAKVNLYKAK